MHVLIPGVATKKISEDYTTNTVLGIIKYIWLTQEKKEQKKHLVKDTNFKKLCLNPNV